MICPTDNKKMKVISTNTDTNNIVTRFYKCLECGETLYTKEYIESGSNIVLDRNKIKIVYITEE